jgi:hypothetical protein
MNEVVGLINLRHGYLNPTIKIAWSATTSSRRMVNAGTAARIPAGANSQLARRQYLRDGCCPVVAAQATSPIATAQIHTESGTFQTSRNWMTAPIATAVATIDQRSWRFEGREFS